MNVCAHKIGTAKCHAKRVAAPGAIRSALGGYCRVVDYAAPFTYDIRWCFRSAVDTFNACVRDFWPGRVLARNGWY